MIKSKNGKKKKKNKQQTKNLCKNKKLTTVFVVVALLLFLVLALLSKGTKNRLSSQQQRQQKIHFHCLQLKNKKESVLFRVVVKLRATRFDESRLASKERERLGFTIKPFTSLHSRNSLVWAFVRVMHSTGS